MNDQMLLMRVPVPDTDHPEELVRREILTSAEKELGYKYWESERMVSRNKMTRAFRVMGLDPFSPHAVAAHKEAAAKRRDRSPFWDAVASFPDSTSRSCLAMTFLSLIAAFILPFVVSDHVLKWELMMAGIFILFLGAFAFFLIADNLPSVKIIWQRLALRSYNRAVPEFVLVTALELQRRVPNVTFMIDELVVNEMHHDTFLVSVVEGQEYYLEMWAAQPQYEQEHIDK